MKSFVSTLNKSRLGFILNFFITLIIFFVMGKLFFFMNNSAEYQFSIADIAKVIAHGFTMDASTTCYFLAVPLLLSFVSIWWKNMPVRKILIPYYIIISILIALVIGADGILYEFWKFKLCADVFSYAKSAEGATSSVGIGFILIRIAIVLVVISLMVVRLIQITPKKFYIITHKPVSAVVLIIVGMLTGIMARGRIGEKKMSVGSAYFSDKLFLNHAAVNPAFNMGKSLLRSGNFADQFNYLSEKEREATFSVLYPESTDDITDTLLTTQRPNILVVFMESFGGKFIEELGGVAGVSPNFSRLIKEGVFFDNYYASSFRTDRGTVCNYSGYVSFPSTSLMCLPDHNKHLPAIGLTLKKAGYSTTYLYGGEITHMGKRDYLVSAGYDTLISDKDFTKAEIGDDLWGANDSLSAEKTFSYLMSLPKDKPWHMGYQTLSSHEPFDVPYHRLENKILNAFAFTDECVGRLVDKLKASPLWENTLIILMPDHGFLYEMSYNNDEFFHCPMLWLGGAIKEPRRIHTIMSQSDFAATLLSQLSLPHDDFKWSRNVFSKNYKYPFAYSSYPGGIMFKDNNGTTMFEISSEKVIFDKPNNSQDRLKKAKAILQTSYDVLEKQK